MAEATTTIQPTRQDIMDRLTANTVTGGLIVGVMVHRGQITDGARVPTDAAGRMLPYISVVFGGRGKASHELQGIGSTRDDLKLFSFGIECYAGDPVELDELADRIVDILEGYEPVNAGEIGVMTSGRIQNPADVKQNHSRAGLGLIFQCYVGTVTPVVL